MPIESTAEERPSSTESAPAEGIDEGAALERRLEMRTATEPGGFREAAPPSLLVTQLASRDAPPAEHLVSALALAGAVMAWEALVLVVGVALLLRFDLSSGALAAWIVVVGMVPPVLALYARSFLRSQRFRAERRVRIAGDDVELIGGGPRRKIAASAIKGVRAEEHDLKWRVVIERDDRDEVALEGLRRDEAERASEALRRAVARRE